MNEDYIKKLEETNKLLEQKLDEFRNKPHTGFQRFASRSIVTKETFNDGIFKNMFMEQTKLKLFEMLKDKIAVTENLNNDGNVVLTAELWVMDPLGNLK
jgi:hypothetical protein